MAFKRILVPLDGSRDGSKAVDLAGNLAKSLGAEVLLLRVVVAPRVPVAAVPGPEAAAAAAIAMESTDEQVRADKATARKYLGGQRTALQGRGVEVSTMVEAGDAARTVLRVAKQEKCDLIVMTTRGRTGVRRALLGSVADEVVRASVAPVLVVRR